MKSIGFKFWRIGIFLFMRNVWKYKHFVLLPTLALDAVKGYDRYADLELKFLCFGVPFYMDNQKDILTLCVSKLKT